MADQRAEARRRRILRDPAKRLERLQNLSRQNDDPTEETTSKPCCETFSEPNKDIASPPDSSKRLEADDISSRPEPGKEDVKKTIETDKDMKGEGTTYENEDDIIEKLSACTDLAPKPSWLRRKYRFILFVMLAWVLYMVVAKEFHFVFAYLIGQQLPHEMLPVLILTAFVAVEVQVVMLSLLLPPLPQSEQVTSKPAYMFVLALSLCGIPRTTLESLMNMVGRFSACLSDFCVYVFVIVTLKVLDEGLY